MIIGFVGKARSGKDTAGEYLVKDYGYTRVSFADELKKMAMNHFNLTHDECYVDKTELSRRILQGLGVCMRDEVDENYWVDYALKDIPKNVAITDVRFLNEAKAIVALGGILVRIERPDLPTIEYGADHSSEVEQTQIGCIYEVQNDGTLDEFYHKISDIMKGLT